MKVRLAGSALFLGACATPRGPLESEERIAVPLAAERAPEAPAVLLASAGEVIRGAVASSAARGGATLAECFRIAEATQEDLLAGEESSLRALLERDEALANFFPRLDLRGTYFRQNEVTQGSGSSFFTTSPDRTEWALVVFQPLFDGFRDRNAMRAAERSAEARTADRQDLRRLLLASVARAFYGVLQSEAEVRTLEESRRRDEARTVEMRARFEQGLARRTEVLLNESRLATAEADLRRARTTLEVRRAVFDRLLGVRLGVPLVASEEAAPDLLGSAEAVAEAARARPDLRAAALDAEAAEARLAEARGESLPTLGLSVNRYLARDNFSAFATETRWDARLELDVPIFAGGARWARARRASSEAREARLALSSAHRRVGEEVESARARAAAGAELLATFETNARSARENHLLLEEEYRAGIATNLEVLVAQAALDGALLDLERQRLQNRLDRVEFEVALGRVEP